MVAYHNDLSSMIDVYAMYLDFANVMFALSRKDTRSICTKRWISFLWLKAKCHKGFESKGYARIPCWTLNEGHRCIQATMNAKKIYFTGHL